MMQLIKQMMQASWLPSRYGKAPYFWLMSFVMFAWKYYYLPPSTLELSLLALSFLFFIPLYLYSFWVHDWRAFLCIAITCALGLVWANYNYGSSSFIIFAATMCARFPNQKQAYWSFLAVFAAVIVGAVLFHFETFFWVPALIFSVPSSVGALMAENAARANQKLFRKQEEIEHLASLAERERIARDLHDLLGHTLSVITLKAELARKLFERDHEACRKEISEIEQTAREALAQVRSAVLGYRDTGLVYELRNAHNTLETARVEFLSELEIEKLPPAIENVLALALREAITNIIRHSQATRCEVSIIAQENNVRLRIADNGFPQHLDKALSLRKGNGLSGMNERVSALHGNFNVHIDGGVVIEIELPLPLSAKVA